MLMLCVGDPVCHLCVVTWVGTVLLHRLCGVHNSNSESSSSEVTSSDVVSS